MNRPETIEETAALVDEAGGRGIAVRVDHLVPDEVRALVARIEREQGALHVLVNDIWGATKMEWNKTVWESSLDYGLRTLRLAVDTHAITSHFALPLLIKTPGGLVVEVTDGTDEYNATNYRVSFFYDLAKAAVNRMAFALAHELGPHGATAGVAHAGLAALRGHARRVRRHRVELARRDQACHRTSRSPRARRSSAAPSRRSPQDPDVSRWNGKSLSSGQLAQGLRLHRPRRQPARRLAVPRRGAGRRQAGRHDRLSLNGWDVTSGSQSELLRPRRPGLG